MIIFVVQGLNQYHAAKTYGGVGVRVHTFI